jgi:hypothetical protein
MKMFIAIGALLGLTACAGFVLDNYPTQSAKALDYINRGLDTYCNLSFEDRQAIRAAVNDAAPYAFVACTEAEIPSTPLGK